MECLPSGGQQTHGPIRLSVPERGSGVPPGQPEAQGGRFTELLGSRPWSRSPLTDSADVENWSLWFLYFLFSREQMHRV